MVFFFFFFFVFFFCFCFFFFFFCFNGVAALYDRQNVFPLIIMKINSRNLI